LNHKPLVNTLGTFLLHPNPRSTIPSPTIIFPKYTEESVPDDPLPSSR
jgi:hypothetical protein